MFTKEKGKMIKREEERVNSICRKNFISLPSDKNQRRYLCIKGTKVPTITWRALKYKVRSDDRNIYQTGKFNEPIVPKEYWGVSSVLLLMQKMELVNWVQILTEVVCFQFGLKLLEKAWICYPIAIG